MFNRIRIRKGGGAEGGGKSKIYPFMKGGGRGGGMIMMGSSVDRNSGLGWVNFANTIE